MSVPMDFKITPPKVKPHRGISLARLVLRPLACIFGPQIVPLIVYFVEGCTGLFWWILGFGFFISIILMILDHGKVKAVTRCLKINCHETLSRRKLLSVPSYYKNLSPLKLSPEAGKSPGSLCCAVLDRLDQSVSATKATIVDIPISFDCPSSSSFSVVELDVAGLSQQLTTLTPTKRKGISASPVSLSPLRYEMKVSTKTSPFSKRRAGFSGCVSPRHLRFQEAKHLSTILESPYPDCNDGNSQSRSPTCFSS